MELTQEWYCASALARLKGIHKMNLSRHRWMLPCNGAGARLIAGRWRWNRSAVEPWLLQDDEELWRQYRGAVNAAA